MKSASSPLARKLAAAGAALLRPATPVLVALVALSAAALVAVFATGATESALAYVAYPLSAYALVIVMVRMPQAARAGSRSAKRISRAGLRRLPQPWRRHLSDARAREALRLRTSFAASGAYGLFCLVGGVQLGSAWLVTLAVYYLLLGGLDLSLAHCLSTAPQRGGSWERRQYRRCAWALIVLDGALASMAVQMTVNGSGFAYPGYLVYGVALFAFYSVIASAVGVVRTRNAPGTIPSAAKAVSLASALVSILALQTALISQFSTEGEGFRILMNSLTGLFVFGIIFAMAALMLVRTRRGRTDGDARGNRP